MENNLLSKRGSGGRLENHLCKNTWDCRLERGKGLCTVITRSTRSFRIVMTHLGVGEGGKMLWNWGSYLGHKGRTLNKAQALVVSLCSPPQYKNV